MIFLPSHHCPLIVELCIVSKAESKYVEIYPRTPASPHLLKGLNPPGGSSFHQGLPRAQLEGRVLLIEMHSSLIQFTKEERLRRGPEVEWTGSPDSCCIIHTVKKEGGT